MMLVDHALYDPGYEDSDLLSELSILSRGPRVNRRSWPATIHNQSKRRKKNDGGNGEFKTVMRIQAEHRRLERENELIEIMLNSHLKRLQQTELEQLLLLGRREGILDRCGLADECPQGRDAGCGHILPRGRTDMDLFNLIRAPNPTKVKVGSRPRAPHKIPLLTLTAHRVIEMDEPAATDSSGVSSTIERSPLDFAHEAGASDQGAVTLEIPSSEDVPATVASGVGQAEETAAMDPPTAPESRKRGHDGTDVNAPPKSLRRDYADPQPSGSSHPLSFDDAPSRHPADVAQSSQGVAAVGDPRSENASSPAEYNINIARQVAMGSQLCLRFEQEAKLLRKSVAQVARWDQRIQAQELEIKKSGITTGDQGRNEEGYERQECWADQRIRRPPCPVSGEEKLKASFEEFKRYEDERVERRCAELDARLDALSIDFDEELYPHMLTAITGRRWVIGHGLCLAMMKCAESLEMRQAFADVMSAGVAKGMSEGLKHGVEHGQAQLKVESIEAYDPEAEAKFSAALQSLKDLKYPLLDQLESLKDAPMDVIMAALYLETDTGEDAPQYIRDLRPNSSQLTILVYPEVRDPRNPWAYKEEMKLSDAIAANITRVEKKKKCRIVCRTHGVGSAHHARSDGVPASVPTVVPQGLALLLVDAATQTGFEDT
uniref:Transposase (Putative), gypsy type n=1 Tax=Tanacetum cinerariifolium TaxID=118510 RepID=A0A6L2MBJ6_TANCI|nr:transposase (putative), gypsy type [Tanacetum cinerariifolium]